MDAIQMQAMSIAEQRRRTDLLRIEATLRRLEEGEHGLCARCGEEIATKRLELDPATSTCAECATS